MAILGEKSGGPASEDTWRMEVKREIADPGAIPTEEIAEAGDAQPDTPTHGYGEKRLLSLTAEYERG